MAAKTMKNTPTALTPLLPPPPLLLLLLLSSGGRHCPEAGLQAPLQNAQLETPSPEVQEGHLSGSAGEEPEGEGVQEGHLSGSAGEGGRGASE